MLDAFWEGFPATARLVDKSDAVFIYILGGVSILAIIAAALRVLGIYSSDTDQPSNDPNQQQPQQQQPQQPQQNQDNSNDQNIDMYF